MIPFPLNLSQLLLPIGVNLIYILIGFGFGYALEISGFANSPKLAAQFYFKDMTVLKVMFTAIIVAMVLIFAAAGLGLLDYNLIWVNPTYLWPGIVGGLIMGVGFIIGGFCPGTSLVAAAVARIDGILFALGGLFGIFLFGETVDKYAIFFNSSYMGRFTLMDWLRLPAGVVVVLVVLMALFMFWGGEHLERIFGKVDLKKAPKSRYYAAGGLLAAALAVMVIGQPNTMDKWNLIAAEKGLLLDARSVQIHPGELLTTLHDHKLNTILLDVRSEIDYNLFHIAGARRVELADVSNMIAQFHLEPKNTVFIVMSNDETAATEAWKILVAESVPNAYILEGGVNNWISVFGGEDTRIHQLAASPGDDMLRFEFYAALGAAYHSADPIPGEIEVEYTPKIQLEFKRGTSGGGCG